MKIGQYIGLLKKCPADKQQEMSKCRECSYYPLFKMVKSGNPFQYFGDVPCNRCYNFKKKNSEFTPASKEILQQAWEALNNDLLT